MTRKLKTPELLPRQADPDRYSEKPRGGLTKETVDEIYEYVLSGGASSRTPKGQFTKGSSGNPKGRPKRVSISPVAPPSELEPESLSAIALRHAARKVKAQTEDGEIEITLKEAALAKMAREAIRGNTGHSRTFTQLVSRAEVEESKRKGDAFRHWAKVKEQAEELYAQAERAGEQPPLSVHPEDIELYTDGTVAIVGPTGSHDIRAMRETHSRVDYHLVHIAYHQWLKRRCIRLYGGRLVEGPLYAELEFWSEQNDLPPRLRMTVDEVVERLQFYGRMSGRALHTLLREEGKPHGYSALPRELRVPLIIPIEAVELAKAKGVSVKLFLPVWLEASAAWWRKQAERAKAVKP